MLRGCPLQVLARRSDRGPIRGARYGGRTEPGAWVSLPPAQSFLVSSTVMVLTPLAGPSFPSFFCRARQWRPNRLCSARLLRRKARSLLAPVTVSQCARLRIASACFARSRRLPVMCWSRSEIARRARRRSLAPRKITLSAQCVPMEVFGNLSH